MTGIGPDSDIYEVVVAHEVKKKTAYAPVEKPHKAEPAHAIPETDSADISIKLVARNYISKYKVFTVFDVDFRGRFVFKNKSEHEDMVKVTFPFPTGTTQAKDVSLKILSESGDMEQADDARFYLQGIEWFGILPHGKLLTMEVTYNTQGYDRYIYEGPGSGRAGSLHIDMTLEDVSAELIPEYALQPTEIKPGHLIWDFKNLITDRRITVELPGDKSPTGRVILLLRLAGISVLLFGLGFMYLNDLKQPGRHEDFRLGHFLLLALTYSLFFFVFTALNLGGGVKTVYSLLWALLLSLPLLFIHVGRYWGFHFSLTRILPLALFTLGIVINGVYGGQYRLYFFIAFTVAIVGFLTLSYQTWFEKRKIYKQEKEERDRERYRVVMEQEQELEREKQENVQIKKKQEQQKQKEKERFRWRNSLKGTVTSSLKEASQLFREATLLENRAVLLLEFEDPEKHLRTREFVEKRLSSLSEQRQEHNKIQSQGRTISNIEDDTEYEHICNSLKDSLSKLNIQVKQSLVLLEEALQDLTQLRERARVVDTRQQDIFYCHFCGAAHQHATYCPHCGVRDPVKLTCQKCGETYMLPIQMIDEQKAADKLHCHVCGQTHNYQFSKKSEA
ncbi:hypothetical protein ACFL27_15825 [candidate division CSSED10-310 bacterium]|uniref:DZANK-type domain-containing protein n=1 Tax=candidate division CSSED10-310 bacterium TaxID=2855610 RepID=A0ABV6YZN4_UNCC1